MNRVLVSVVLSSFVAPFSTSALGVSLLLVARDLGAASVDSVEALVALTLAVAMFVLPLGRAADLLGHVVVFRMGLLLAVAGFALASLSPNFPCSAEPSPWVGWGWRRFLEVITPCFFEPWRRIGGPPPWV